MSHYESFESKNEFTALKRLQEENEKKMLASMAVIYDTKAGNKERRFCELTNKPAGKTMPPARGRNNSNKISINTAKRIREAERKDYEKLQSMLPISSTKQKRTTRVDILKHSSDYIEILQKMIEDLTDDVLEELIDEPTR